MNGIGVSPGIAIGTALVINFDKKSIQRINIDKDKIDNEINRFNKACNKSKNQLLKLRNKLEAEIGKEHAFIFDSQIAFIEDILLINKTIDTIKTEQVNAEWALYSTIEYLKGLFSQIEDEYLSERVTDINDISNRVFNNLTGDKRDLLSKLNKDVILVSHELSPSDTAILNKKRIKGIITEIGGRTSHTAIMSRALEIPAVVGIEKITLKVVTGDPIIIDGSGGKVFIKPSPTLFREYLDKERKYKYFTEQLLKDKDLPAITKDQYTIGVDANIELPEEISSVFNYGAEGIGLYRTEFLFMNRLKLPTEEEQFEVYKDLAIKMGNKSIVIRTLDIGGDKFLSNLNVPNQLQGSLGLRAIRFCLYHIDIFKTQLRAILRASAFGNIKILYPLITNLEELRSANNLLEELKVELKKENKKFNEKILSGIMIEVPSAALIADLLAKETDFFSIGTNDLIQYTLAIERINDLVSYLYEPLHPSILKLIKITVEAAQANGIWTTICGEMASDPIAAFVLIGLGIDELSMNPISIPKMKKLIRSISFEEALKVSKIVLSLNDALEIRDLVSCKINKFIKDCNYEN